MELLPREMHLSCCIPNNRFVNSAMGVPYDVTFSHVMDACKKLQYTQEQVL